MGVQAAVVGLTCRLDAIELMEKRVRSRFSHEKEIVVNPQDRSTDLQVNTVPALHLSWCSHQQRACAADIAEAHRLLRAANLLIA